MEKSLIKEMQPTRIAGEPESRDSVVTQVMLEMWQKIVGRCKILRKLRRVGGNARKRRLAWALLCMSLGGSFMSFCDMLCCFCGLILAGPRFGISGIHWVGTDRHDDSLNSWSWVLGIMTLFHRKTFHTTKEHMLFSLIFLGVPIISLVYTVLVFLGLLPFPVAEFGSYALVLQNRS